MNTLLESIITCPQCGHQKTEIMLTNACQFFYECSRCQTILRPLTNDCCVFCSYGSMPPI
ncbi:GDCCVxC domain-containing (seleno)protein [Spirosoma areae]